MSTKVLHVHIQASSSYTATEGKFLKPWQNMRQVLLRPITKMLIALKVTPNMLSYASIVFGLGFAIFASTNFTLACWLLAVSILCDAFDGVVARELKIASTQGAFTDAVCDQTVLALCITGLTLKGLVNPILAILFVYIYTTFMMFIVLHNILAVPSEFILRPGRNILFILVGVYYFLQINILNDFILVSILTVPLLLISFRRLRGAL